HGKSTLLGRIFYDLGLIEEKTLERARKYAEIFGQKGFDFAYLMDSLKEERARGITINLGHKKLETKKVSITFGDAPGHHDFLKNMLVGAAESDAAVVVVAADEGPQKQTREHLFLAKMLGVPNVVVVINKMDLVGYKEQRFEKIKEEVIRLLKKAGYSPEEATFLPAAALYGENVIHRTEKMKWFSGPTVLGAIENLPSVKIPNDLPLRLPVQDVYSSTRQGKEAVVGRVVSGEIRGGDRVTVYPSKKEFVVQKIFIQEKEVPLAQPGDNLYLFLGNKKGEIKRGEVIAFADTPPVLTKQFAAAVIFFGISQKVKAGTKMTFSLLTEQVECEVKAVVKKIDTVVGTELSGEEIGNNEAGEVIIKTKRTVFIEEQEKNPSLARFNLKQGEQIIGMGICLEVIDE
ncbi:elongation factor 1-alpha, partial [bacterium]|nr:elongation factor 1-alpha [bacterium]